LLLLENLTKDLICGIPPQISAERTDQSALMRAANRDSLRETVFLCSTPLVIARCSSGCASRKADCAAVLSPVEIAVSTFLTKLRTRLARARLIAVRLAVCRTRFSADLWLAMQFAVDRDRAYIGTSFMTSTCGIVMFRLDFKPGHYRRLRHLPTATTDASGRSSAVAGICLLRY
jgi:hypothetical protein